MDFARAIPPVDSFLFFRRDRRLHDLGLAVEARPLAAGSLALSRAYRDAVEAACARAVAARASGLAVPEGDLDGKGRWRPSKREACNHRQVRMEADRLAYCRSRAHVEKLVLAWLYGAPVPPDVAEACQVVEREVERLARVLTRRHGEGVA